MNQNETPTTLMQIAVKFGLILGMSLIALTLLAFISNSLTSQQLLWSVLNYALIFTLCFFSMKSRKNDIHEGYLTYGQALGIGVLVAVFAGFLSGLYQILHTTFVDPEFFDKLINETKKALIERNTPEEQMETTLAMMRKMQSPVFLFFTNWLGIIFMGFLFSLIAAIFTRKSNPNSQYTE